MIQLGRDLDRPHPSEVPDQVAAARGLRHGGPRLCAQAERTGEEHRPRHPEEERLTATAA